MAKAKIKIYKVQKRVKITSKSNKTKNWYIKLLVVMNKRHDPINFSAKYNTSSTKKKITNIST